MTVRFFRIEVIPPPKQQLPVACGGQLLLLGLSASGCIAFGPVGPLANHALVAVAPKPRRFEPLGEKLG